MHNRKTPIVLSVTCFVGIVISSLSISQQSAFPFVISSWIKPFCAIGFISGIGIYYAAVIGEKRFLLLARTFFISAFFFLIAFFIYAFFFKSSLALFSGIHSYILSPTLIAVIIMVSITVSKSTRFPPFDSLYETVAAALMPLHMIIIVSLVSSMIFTGNARIQLLSRDYFIKPALYKEITLEQTKKTDNVIYSGPLEITYSMDFIRLYGKVIAENTASSGKSGNASIRDYAVFSGYYMFVTDRDGSYALHIYRKDGSFIRRIDNISRIYHSDQVLAAVNSSKKQVIMYDSSFNETFTITFPPTLNMEKVVFSHELFALHYSQEESEFERPDTFSVLYRLDTGSRIGRITSADIAPRLRATGFVAVDNTDKGLYITVLDRNANKKSYLFKGGEFSNAVIRQCGADRFFVKAQAVKNGEVSSEYLLVYDFHRYKKIHQSFTSGKDIHSGMGDIIAVIGRFLLTDDYALLDKDLNEIVKFKRPHNIPHRLLMPSDDASSFDGEGSVSEIDFSPFLDGYDRSPAPRVLLADMKGTLIIKKVIEFSDYYLVMTNNLIFAYDRNLQLLKKIVLPENGYIDAVKILTASVLLTFYTEEGIYIYSINSDLDKILVTSINTRQGKIWDISEEAIVFGREFRPLSGSRQYDDSAIIIAQDMRSDRVYERVLMSQLYSSPSIEKSRLFLPSHNRTEIVELNSGKRTVIDGNIVKTGNKPYGIMGSGLVIELSTLTPFPYRFNTDRIGTNVMAEEQWIDLHGYVVNPATLGVFEIVRSGITSLGKNSICSSTIFRDKKMIHCLDLGTMSISTTFPVNDTDEIVYSNPDIIFLKDNHSLSAVVVDRHNKKKRVEERTVPGKAGTKPPHPEEP